MLKNYLKTAFRNLLKQRVFSFINIVGLASGMAVVILILLWISDEWSYDRHHELADRIYRVVEIQHNQGRNQTHVPYTMAPLAETMKAEFPEIIDSVRLKGFGNMTITRDQVEFHQKNILMADPSIFAMFSFQWVRGTPEGALDQANTAVISKSVAKKLFGDQDPIGQQIRFNTTLVTIKGVIADPPIQSHMNMDVILSYKTMEGVMARYGFDPQEFMRNWNNNSLFTYILLKEGVAPSGVESKLPDFLKKHKGPDNTIEMYLQNLRDIYLKSELIGFTGAWKKGNRNHVIMFFMIAVFILIIACINFMNLTTARSANRAREVGLRKVFGGSRNQLIFQFLSESLVVTCIAMILAISLVEFLIPFFNSLAAKNLSFDLLSNWHMVLGLIIITGLVSLFAGSYPAFYLSKFEPNVVLKGRLSSGSKNTILRKFLVVFQFSISIMLIIGTWTMFRQMEFMFNRDLGFDKEHVLIIENLNPEQADKMDGFKKLLTSNHHVVSATLCSRAPGQGTDSQYGMIPDGAEETQDWVVPVQSIDEHYFETFDLKMVAGHPFTEEFRADMQDGLIINETAARKFGWKDAIGKRIEIPSAELPGNSGRVIGVAKDFFFQSLHQEIEPLVMFRYPKMFQRVAIRILPGQTQETIAFIEHSWRKVTGNAPFKFHFLDRFIEDQYQNEVRVGKLFIGFSILAILIASLGLLGLASYATEQRTKEIGIRKILGASTPQVVYTLTKEFTQWVLFANLISWPIAWYLMDDWLSGFAYRISIPITIFIAAGGLALLIACATIGYQVVRTAKSNPVIALKYE